MGKLFAYRGFKNTYPENTLAAFKKACNSAVDGIHADVQVLFDKTVIVHRDVPLGRCEDKKGHIYDYRKDNFQSFSVGDLFSDKYAFERIPLFEDVVKMAKEAERLLGVEICYDARPDFCFVNDPVKPVMEILEKYEMKEKTYITSFNHLMLKELKEKYPEYKALVTFLTDQNLDIVNYVFENGFDGVHCHHNYLTENFALRLKEKGCLLSVYGVSEYDTLQKCEKSGADYINLENLIGSEEK